jgi:5-methyltetrahydropteroyltriglutamate--homocysteine methyltransferase
VAEPRPDRILTTHVGSLIRPPQLVALLQAKSDGNSVDEAELERVRKLAIADVVQRQIDIGIDIVSDGEFGKSISWSRYVLERLSGFDQKREAAAGHAMPTAVFGKDRRTFADFYAQYDSTQNFTGMRGWAVVGPIAYKGKAQIERDISSLKSAIAGLEPFGCFMPAVSPASVAPDRQDSHYKSFEESSLAIAEALRDEYRAIVNAGYILQVDDSYFASMYDKLENLTDYRRWASQQVELINHSLEGVPIDRTRFHVCWGSWNGPHVGDVEMKDIVDIMLKIRVGGYSIEMANPRHEHEWHVWENTKLPEGRALIPGVIAHVTNVVEHPELVCERIVRLAKLVGRENVIASTDCGFAQGPFVQRVHPSIQWAKLQALVDGARLATKVLWNK